MSSFTFQQHVQLAILFLARCELTVINDVSTQIQRFLGSEGAAPFLQWKQTPRLFLLLLRLVWFCLHCSITIRSREKMVLENA